MNLKELEKIQLKNDGKDGERFEQALKKVVNVPKDTIKEREKAKRVQGDAKR